MIRPRSLARRLALQYCFMCDLSEDWEGAQPVMDFLHEHCDDAQVRTFAARLIEEVVGNLKEIDHWISVKAKNWSIARIAGVERNVLRVACAEVREGVTPVGVIINEAVGMAKKFGSKDSGKFVNGVLDKIAKTDKNDFPEIVEETEESLDEAIEEEIAVELEEEELVDVTQDVELEPEPEEIKPKKVRVPAAVSKKKTK